MPDSEVPAKNGITVEKSELLKGIALVLLIWHHLFGCGFLEDWLSINNKLDLVIGLSGNICVAIFLFCSGYGYYRSYICKNNTPKIYILQKLISTLIPYWLVMIISIIILVFLGKFEPEYLWVNLLSWVHDDSIMYVTFSWFIKLYVLLIVLLPLVKLIDRHIKKHWLLNVAVYILLPVAIYYLYKFFLEKLIAASILNVVINPLMLAVFYFPLFSAGMLFAKYDLYPKIHSFASRFPKPLLIVLSLLIIGYVIYLRNILYIFCIGDIIYAPLFIISCLIIADSIKFKSKYALPFLGKNSIYYWLLSGLFFVNTKELQPLITWPRISVFILLWTLIFLTPFVFACNWISNKIVVLLFNKKGSK